MAFVIDPAQSVASFEIDEVLRGSPNHVVGTTSELAGQIAGRPHRPRPPPSSPRSSSMPAPSRPTPGTGTGPIRGPVILNSASDEFEFITFDVTSVDGLSGAAAVGTACRVHRHRGPEDQGDHQSCHLRGLRHPRRRQQPSREVAETTVLRGDFDLGIPNAPGVADVSDEVVIRLEFVATAV